MQGLQFLKFTQAQNDALRRSEDTGRKLESHGVLNKGDVVPEHSHNVGGPYKVVEGAASFFGAGTEVQAQLGDGTVMDAVFVPAGCAHSWKAVKDNTIIRHKFGDEIDEILKAV